MARLNQRTNFRVEVFPRAPSDFGVVSISSIERSETETERMCERIAADIRRHVDDLPSSWSDHSRGVHVAWDNEPFCSHCSSPWTEKSETYNGGCCAEDEKNNPDAAAA